VTKAMLRAIETLNASQQAEGGFSGIVLIIKLTNTGGRGQISHLATTYASVSALAIIGTEEAFKCINRQFIIKINYVGKNCMNSY
jgi:hypothetical protein